MGEFLAAYLPFRAHGCLPHGGGILDQSATFIEAATLMDGLIAQIEAEQVRGARGE